MNVKIGVVNQTEKDYNDGNAVYECGSKDIYIIPKAWTKCHYLQNMKTHPSIWQGTGSHF